MSYINLFNRTVLNGVYLILIFSSLALSRNKDIDPAVTFSNDVVSADASGTLNTEADEKSPYKLGFKIGSHSANLNDDIWQFERDLSFEAYLRYDFSNEVHLLVGYSYWKSRSGGMYYPGGNFSASGIKLDLDFTLFTINNFSVLAGPSITMEDVSTEEYGLLSFAPQLKINHSFWDDRFSIVSTIAYKSGLGGILSFGGGGYSCSFFNYLIGLEIDPWKIARSFKI